MSKSLQEDVQGLYDAVLNELRRVTALEEIDKAGGKPCSMYTGCRLAYSDVARRLVDLGCHALEQEDDKGTGPS